MDTKFFTTEDDTVEFVKKLSADDNTVDVFKQKDGSYMVNWVKNKKYISYDGKEFTDEVWTTEDFRMIHIQDLEPEHAKNIIRMMIRNSREMTKVGEALLDQLTDAFSNLEGNDAPKERVLH